MKHKKVQLNQAEDKAWVYAFNFYKEEGKTDGQADKLAWRDVCLEFPRLRKYQGAK